MSVVVKNLEDKYPIDELYAKGEISKRVWNSLKTVPNIRFLTDFETFSIRDVKTVHGIGLKSFSEIKNLCNKHNIFFRDDIENYPFNIINILTPNRIETKVLAQPGIEKRFFEMLDTLTDEEKSVIESMYRDGLSHVDISRQGRNMFSSEKIRSIGAMGLRKLRHKARVMYIMDSVRSEYANILLYGRTRP